MSQIPDKNIKKKIIIIIIINKDAVNIFTYQCKGLLPSLSGTSGSAFHFETIWYRKAV
jgi:hypothetical protein